MIRAAAGLSMQQGAYRAGWLRIVLSLLGVGFAQLTFPGLARQTPILLAYIGISLVAQVLIGRKIGGEVRGLVTGMIDVAVVTFIVQRLGSVSTMLCSIYVLLGIMMALVQEPRVALAISVLSTLAYVTIVTCEQTGVLPYAPDASDWAAHLPDFRQAVMSTGVMATITVSSTWLVSQVVVALNAREAELEELNARLEALSQRDPLTQLYNRRYLLERIEHELERVRRGHSAALLMIDLDRFKAVNDSEGHLRGDELLVQVGQAIAKATRAVDVVSRYGGDEFAVLLSDASADTALVAAERLTAAIREAGRVFGSGQVSASIGVALAEPSFDSTTLLRLADDRAYEAKQQGGDRVVSAGSLSSRWRI